MSKKDEILESVKALAVAGLPFILPPQGVALLTLANECFNSSGKLRQDKWNAEITSRIANMDKETEQKIRETSNFASILASAQRGALEDMEEDKVSLYANAVINAIKDESIDDTKKHIFLNMLRDFTKLHINTLKFFSLPHQQSGCFQSQVRIANRTTYDIIVEYDNSLDRGADILEIVMQDLKIKSMLVVGKIEDIQTTYGLPKQTTQLADEFLAFISEQDNAND